MNKSNILILGLAIAGLALAGACQAVDPKPDAVEADQAAAATNIMDQPLDGSSIASFEQGMERVKAEGAAGQHGWLDSAVKYLLVYDLSVKRDKAALYKKLDGKTPTEIIAKASR